jgi:hypothetical protein
MLTEKYLWESSERLTANPEITANQYTEKCCRSDN